MSDKSKSSVALRGFTLLVAGLAMLLAGCGQKGPLTLPAAAPASAASAGGK